MAITTREARERILDDLAQAGDRTSLAVARLGEAFERLDAINANRLETELFRPAQRALARARRAQTGFAERAGLPARELVTPAPSAGSHPARLLVERAVSAGAEADAILAELQDSGLAVESGDPELRAGVAEARELLGRLPAAATGFLRTLGR